MAFQDSGQGAGPGGSPNVTAPQGPGGPPGGGSALLQAIQQRRAQPSSPGLGNQAEAVNQLKIAVQMIQTAMPGLPMGTPIHTAAINALRQLTRHITNTAPLGTQQTGLQDALRNNMRQQLMAQLMQRQQMGSGGGGGGSTAPQPPMPSTPLPGA